tara:strand:- start:1 stop:195 length:195 start_codon:yes stop_codon:yes gene_type:complete
MRILNIVVLMLFVTGCAQTNSLLQPPPFYLCEPNEQLLICSSSDLTECDGFLKDKPIIIEEIEI